MLASNAANAASMASASSGSHARAVASVDRCIRSDEQRAEIAAHEMDARSARIGVGIALEEFPDLRSREALNGRAAGFRLHPRAEAR